ncbi:hypothetical protein NGUA15_00879 [Salmonella enterica]|nr:hypothetical protein NGUA15_00879 [Salmonella enterica]
MRIFHHAVWANFAVIANNAVFNNAARADLHAVTERHVTFDDNVSVNFHITPVNQITAQIKTCRITKHHPCQQQFLRLFGLVNTLQTRKL